MIVYISVLRIYNESWNRLPCPPKLLARDRCAQNEHTWRILLWHHSKIGLQNFAQSFGTSEVRQSVASVHKCTPREFGWPPTSLYFSTRYISFIVLQSVPYTGGCINFPYLRNPTVQMYLLPIVILKYCDTIGTNKCIVQLTKSQMLQRATRTCLWTM